MRYFNRPKYQTQHFIVLIFSVLFICLIPSHIICAEPKVHGLLGQNLKGVKKIIGQLNQNRMKKTPYTIPTLIQYSEATPNECKQLGEIILFKNDSVRVETNSYHTGELEPWKEEGRHRVEKIYLYFTPPLAPGAALKTASDFAPFLKSSHSLKKTRIGPEEGNECTPGEGGIRYQQGNYMLELFYQDDSNSNLVNQALISFEMR